MCLDWITSAWFCQLSLTCKLIAVQPIRLSCKTRSRIHASTSCRVLGKVNVGSDCCLELACLWGDHELFGIPYSQEPVAVLRQTNPFWQLHNLFVEGTLVFFHVTPSVPSFPVRFCQLNSICSAHIYVLHLIPHDFAILIFDEKHKLWSFVHVGICTGWA
jgi:hypothetical protein